MVGVTPAAFFGLDPARSPDFFVPLHLAPELLATGAAGAPRGLFTRDDAYWVTGAARLAPGMTRERAEAIVGPPFAAMVTDSVGDERGRLRFVPTLDIVDGAGGIDGLRSRYREPVLLLFGMVVVILAIGCANIASLLLSRATVRRREMAVRLSVGAGRGSVIRQLLVESVLLSLAGGAAGVVLSVWGTRALAVLLANGDDGFTLRAAIEWRVLAFTLAVSAATGVLFGLAPALQATRVDLLAALKDSRLLAVPRRGARRAAPGAGQVLVVAQIALSLVLLVAAGLFARSLSNLRTVELGFNKENLLLAEVGALRAGYMRDIDGLKRFYTDLRSRLQRIPGVEDVSMSWSVLAGGDAYARQVVIPGITATERSTNVQVVGAGFFRTMQIPMVAGREMTEAEVVERRPVAVVDRRFADQYFGRVDPIGRTIEVTGEGQLEVVGVSEPARHDVLKGDARPVVYYSYAWDPHPLFNLVFELRTQGEPLAYAGAVRTAVRDQNPGATVTGFRTQVNNIDRTINQEIVFASLSNVFAVLALAIACVGLYSTVSYAMSRRTTEMGLRLALGARRTELLVLALRQVLLLGLAGLLIGVPAALVVSRAIERFLWRIEGHDPVTMASAATTALTAIVLAGYVPAWRAARTNPLVAMRAD